LVKKGVAANRITTKSKGSANPVGDNKTKQGRAKNRRVEIHSVINKEEKKVRVEGVVPAPAPAPAPTPAPTPTPTPTPILHPDSDLDPNLPSP
jgi:hypothetical protein